MAPIISTILMVAITVVLAAVVFVMVSGMLVKPPPAPAAITLESRDWTGANYTASVTGVTGMGGVSPVSLSFIVEDDGGNAYFSGQINDTNTLNGVDTTLRYNDLDGNNQISPGDQVVIEVAPLSGKTALEGGVLKILNGEQQVANHGIFTGG